MKNAIRLSVALLLGALLPEPQAQAQSMRPFRKIEPRPPRAAAPERDLAASAADAVAGAWNAGELQGALAAEFAEGAVLAQTVHGKNTEASLHVESVRAVHNLGTARRSEPGIGTVRATVLEMTVSTRTYVEDPNLGLLNVPGENRVIIELIELP